MEKWRNILKKYLALSQKEKIKYSILCLIVSFVLLGFVLIISSKESSVNKIQLSIQPQDYYKNEDIEVNVEVNNLYQLSEDQIEVWGGSVKKKGKNTFILNYPNTGTFHVFAHANGLQSNELIIKVVSENASANRVQTNTDTEVTAQEVLPTHKPKIPQVDQDLSNPNVLFAADASDLVDANELADYKQSYVGYTFAFEAYIPEDAETYVIAPNGGRVYVNNLDTVQRYGPIRLYGTMEADGFHAEIYSYVK